MNDIINIILESPETQVLVDVHPKTGELVPWQRKKKETLEMAASCRRIQKIDPAFEFRAFQLEKCGNYLEFHRAIKTGERTLSRANFCKYRLCPMCSWRRSLKIFGQASQVMEEAEKQGYRFVFVTLTVKNCQGVDLRSELTKLYAGSLALLRRKRYKKAVHGWMRVLEVTHNINFYDKSFDTYHPHVHFIWAVKGNYFKKAQWISQADLTHDWGGCMKLDYKPLVDIRAVKKRDKKAIKEVSKYSVKPGEILVQDRDLTDSAVWTLDQALEKKRMVSWGLVLKSIKASLNLDDAENGDLVNTDSEQPLNQELDYIVEKYKWNVGFGWHQRIE